MALNVLVVDDSAVMRSMVTKAVKLCGLDIAQILKAKHGGEAIDVMEREPVDVLLIDINMPVKTGEEVVSEIREVVELADIAVVVISSEGSKARVQRLHDLGAALIKKPFNPVQLREILDTLIDDQDKLETVNETADAGCSF